MSYRVEVARSAERELNGLHPEAKRRISLALQRLADEPRPRGARKLSQGHGWRLRVGAYRALYVIDDDSPLVTVFAIRHRSRAYRR